MEIVLFPDSKEDWISSSSRFLSLSIAAYLIFSISVLLPDKPGELHKVSGIIAQANGNVIRLEHNQFVSINRNVAVGLEITLEAFGTEHKQQIIKALADKGYDVKLVQTSI